VVRSSSPATESVRNLLTAGAVLAAGVLVCVLRVACFTSLLDLDAAMLYGQLVFQVAFTACVALGVAIAAGRGDRVNGSTRSAGSSCPA
jgi:hypothetical protein